MKVIVAHEGKQHSFYTAQALYNEGYLFRYVTTVYYKKNNLTYFVSKLLNGKSLEKCKSHRTDLLPDEMVVQFSEWRGLLMLFMKRIPWLWKRFPRYYDWLHDAFGKQVAIFAIKNEVDVVIMYDTNANKCWEILNKKAPKIKRVLDVSIANRLFLKSVYEEDIRNYGNNGLMNEQKDLWDPINIKRNIEELSLTQFYLAGSSFVMHSLEYSNINSEKIFVIPYGVDNSQFKKGKNKNVTLPIKVIFVGQISYRKGIHHLLKVASSFSPDELELHILGAYDSTEWYYRNYSGCKNVYFEGFVTRGKIAQFYQEADVFCLPSLGEGLALVILEALGCGLPCIVSDNSGGGDVIVNGENGYLFRTGDDLKLRNILKNLIDNPRIIEQMSYNAISSVERYSWNNYYKKLINAMTQIHTNGL